MVEFDWITYCLLELDVFVKSLMTIKCDNLGATYFANNSTFKTKMKHVALNFHFVRKRVKA